MVGTWIDPDRKDLIRFREYWHWVHTALVAVIVFCVLRGIVTSLWALAASVVYLAYQTGWRWLERHKRSLAVHAAMRWARNYAPVLLAGVLMYLDEAANPTSGGLPWVILLTSMLSVGLELERIAAFTLIGLAGLIVVTPPVANLMAMAPITIDQAVDTLRVPVAQTAVVLLAGLFSYYYSRSIAYLNSLYGQLAHQALPNVAAAASSADLSARAVQSLYRLFRGHDVDLVVNIMDVRQEHLYIRQSSSPAGQRLAGERFNYSQYQGITGEAARSGRLAVLHNIRNDSKQRYFEHAAFSATRSEMAAPIIEDGEVTGVLDVEFPDPFAFSAEDQIALQVFAAMVARLRQQMRVAELHRQLGDLALGVARSAISTRNLSLMLERLAETATQSLGADVISFYLRDAITGQFTGPHKFGPLLSDQEPLPPETLSEDCLVYRIMATGQPRWYEDAPHEPDLITPDAYHRDNGYPVFVDREDIASCAALPLSAGGETFGLFFVNFRQPRSFTTETRAAIQLFCGLATQAIQAGMGDELMAFKRRQQLIDALHDSISHHAAFAQVALRKLGTLPRTSPDWQEAYVAAGFYLQTALRMVDDLIAGREECSLQGLLDDIVQRAWCVETAYDIAVEPIIDRADLDPYLPGLLPGGNHLLHAIDEAIGNALRHAGARRLWLHVSTNDDRLVVRIEDDGRGFDLAHPGRSGMGLANMRRRVETYLGGAFTVESEPNRGTTITMSVALPEPGTA